MLLVRGMGTEVPENGTLKSKLCLRLSLKAIGEHSSRDGIKDSFLKSVYAGALPLAPPQGNNSLDLF